MSGEERGHRVMTYLDRKLINAHDPGQSQRLPALELPVLEDSVFVRLRTIIEAMNTSQSVARQTGPIHYVVDGIT
jgi:hypothetical protein